ncbi:hypothetical protein Q5762_00855 [Streptomyces sp. P9(2023)]|uniref:hypothetical protein n=1 Tax=Streptomyces sp. P9(2023) TaxID=3064394 RepID=UPI0028F4555D|nr:hypothetical protein [Streptomyces sp. P9(2023)]MDT9686924.1 hypothetical protein [Streptomyces sp. P9(2023)]
MATADDDALYVLTAVLLTPAQFPSVLGDDYPAACAALDLEPYAGGYGLVLGQDGAGARWTVIIDDVSLVAVAIASWDCGMEYDLSPDERTVVAALPGWPLAVATAAPGLPDPHDPEPEEGDRPPLSPPDDDGWGPAQRRLGADEVALQWAAWRAQMDENDGDGNEPVGSAPSADAAPGSGSASDSPDPYDGVRRALAELRGYLEDAPPVGRVRSSFASGEARMLRADGPGWSLVARTDDMAFLLLDDEPREVLPVARGSRLPALLEALDAMAVRPS